MNLEREIEDSLRFLNSRAALAALAEDAYWPKWHSPWWHMLLLHEMGETALIPDAIVAAHVAALKRYTLTIFPIQPHEMPAGLDPYRGVPCHCQLGNVYQVLAARGVDVDCELPWMRPWFLRYQMADGGLNCDDSAYRVADETPSSMVGTISAFEAVLLHTPRAWTPEERRFLDLGARFLVGRRLVEGSLTKHNASERESALKWVDLCFPRFYLYDVLRGLNALTLWAEKTGGAIPREAVEEAARAIAAKAPDGQVRARRHSYEGVGTLAPNPAGGDWVYGKNALFFPLLETSSAIGEVSPFLSRQWSEVRKRLARHAHLRDLS